MEKAGAIAISKTAVAVPVVAVPVDSVASCWITKAFALVTDLTSKLRSNCSAVKLVPDNPVVPEKVTMSPAFAPWPVILTVTLAEPFVVVKILDTEDIPYRLELEFHGNYIKNINTGKSVINTKLKNHNKFIKKNFKNSYSTAWYTRNIYKN